MPVRATLPRVRSWIRKAVARSRQPTLQQQCPADLVIHCRRSGILECARSGQNANSFDNQTAPHRATQFNARRRNAAAVDIGDPCSAATFPSHSFAFSNGAQFAGHPYITSLGHRLRRDRLLRRLSLAKRLLLSHRVAPHRQTNRSNQYWLPPRQQFPHSVRWLLVHMMRVHHQHSSVCPGLERKDPELFRVRDQPRRHSCSR